MIFFFALSSPYNSTASLNTVAMLTAIPHAKPIPIRSPVVYLALSVTNQTPANSTITPYTIIPKTSPGNASLILRNIISATVLSVNLFCHFKNIGKSGQSTHDKQWDHDPEHIIFSADPCTKESAHHDRNDHIQSKLQDQCQCLKHLSVFFHLHRSSIKYNLYSL